jgi:hypothetical protein
MHLLPEWRKILNAAWSVRLALVAGIFSGAEAIIPVFVDAMPRGIFAALSMIAAVGGIVARTVAQPNTLP